MKRKIISPFFQPGEVSTKGRCDFVPDDKADVSARLRQAANRLVLLSLDYGKLCPGCDDRYGVSRDGFIDIERCSRCRRPEPAKLQDRIRGRSLK